MSGQRLHALVEYAGLSDPAYGKTVKGVFHPVFSATRVWVVEFPSVRLFHPAPFKGGQPSSSSETVLYIVHPGSYKTLLTAECGSATRNR